MDQNPYYNIVMKNIVPRVLTQLDKDPQSPTFGCFDRHFWHYKIRDFCSMVLQQPTLVLARLYTTNFEGNIYYKNENVKRWTLAAINFWARFSHRDGSSDEYWPNEHGYPPTVFTLYAIAESYRAIGLKDEYIEKRLLKTCKWISKRIEKDAVNQEIASIAALYSVFLITKNKNLLQVIEKKLKYVKASQDVEGWFNEYGGADPGYLSVSLDYLGQYYALSQDKRVLPMVEKILDFVQYFVHPNATYGGEYGSRNTEYFMPAGIELFSKKYKIAKSISAKLTEKIDTAEYLHLGIDDRYLGDYLSRSFVDAMISHRTDSDKERIKLPCEKKTEKLFENAGLYVRGDGKCYLVVGISKGGIVKLYSSDRLILSDCGYRIERGRHKYEVTDWINKEYKTNQKPEEISIEGRFYLTGFRTPGIIMHMTLRLLASILRDKMIKLIKKIFIKKAKKTETGFTRKLYFKNKEMIIHDEISSQSKIRKMASNSRFSLRYVPSSKFFQTDTLRDGRQITLINFKKAIIEKRISLTYPWRSSPVRIHKE